MSGLIGQETTELTTQPPSPWPPKHQLRYLVGYCDRRDDLDRDSSRAPRVVGLESGQEVVEPEEGNEDA